MRTRLGGSLAAPNALSGNKRTPMRGHQHHCHFALATLQHQPNAGREVAFDDGLHLVLDPLVILHLRLRRDGVHSDCAESFLSKTRRPVHWILLQEERGPQVRRWPISEVSLPNWKGVKRRFVLLRQEISERPEARGRRLIDCSGYTYRVMVTSVGYAAELTLQWNPRPETLV